MKRVLMVAACLVLCASASVALAQKKGGGGSASPTPATTCVSANIPAGTTITQTDVNLVVTSWCGNMSVATIDTMSALNEADIVKVLCHNKALPSTREPNRTCS
jgi:hypothetical protein